MKRLCTPVLLLCAAAAALFGPGDARADGLPVLGIDDGASGVATVAGTARYVTLQDGRDTLVARVNPHGGQVETFRLLAGTLTIPAVAYDGSPGGLSADGRRLVLIEPRTSFPRARTKLVVLDTESLRLLETIDLKGDFSFDAVSPHGGFAYLIQYTSPTDPNVYLVRAFDLTAGRLLPTPVTDPREHADKMRGRPLTRVASPDGRWAYTLYDGGSGTPFVHALDTASRSAHCIDLPLLKGSDELWQLHFRLDPSGRKLTLVNGSTPVLAIDTTTFAVGTPPPAPAHAPAVPGSGMPWLVIALSILGGLAAAAAAVLVARRRGAAITRPVRSPARVS